MGRIFTALYRGLITPLVVTGLAVLAPFHAKLAQRRRQQAALWEAARKSLSSDPRRRVWFHAASMGELEQLMPMIEELRLTAPSVCIVTTCTSPSGRDHASRQSMIDHALYLPVDSYGAMQEFIATVDPVLVVIDRYDLWPTMISLLNRRGVTMRLLNATMPSAARLPLVRGFMQRLYSMVDSVTAVTGADAQQLSTLLGRPIEWLPDTRLDRVERKRQALLRNATVLPEWTGRTLVLGSSWPQDESLLLDAWSLVPMQDWRLVIVPHEPTQAALAAIEAKVSCRRLSHLTGSDLPPDVRHIVVDSVGMLLQLYASADAAFVGGGFGAGVHSLAEPAGYGMPIACGPGIERSRDATGLAKHDAIEIIATVDQARRWLENIRSEDYRRRARQSCRAYVEQNTGSTQVHMRWLTNELQRQGIIG